MDYARYKQWLRDRESGKVPPHHGPVTSDRGSCRDSQEYNRSNS